MHGSAICGGAAESRRVFPENAAGEGRLPGKVPGDSVSHHERVCYPKDTQGEREVWEEA